MSPKVLLQITRKQLYDEIWEISIAGVAKKYDAKYSHLMKQIKAANSPVPPPGYWSKVSCGKALTQEPLPEPVDEIIAILESVPSARKRAQSSPAASTFEPVFAEEEVEPVAPNSMKVTVEGGMRSGLGEKNFTDVHEQNATLLEVDELGEPETYESYGHIYNVYDRETLYKEVWEKPVTEVSKRYKVSDVMIHKICKSLNIPTPPIGYWAKVRAGKPVKQIPLPQSKKKKKTGRRTGFEYTSPTQKNTLAFMSEADKRIVLSVAAQIRIPDENNRMHSKIITHRKVIATWRKERRVRPIDGWGQKGPTPAPFLADTISEEALPRVCHIIDALMACTIRAYVQAVGSAPEINEEWINWAKDKANWYDPTIVQEDDFFGVCEHQRFASEKELKASRSYWRG